MFELSPLGKKIKYTIGIMAVREYSERCAAQYLAVQHHRDGESEWTQPLRLHGEIYERAGKVRVKHSPITFTELLTLKSHEGSLGGYT